MTNVAEMMISVFGLVGVLPGSVVIHLTYNPGSLSSSCTGSSGFLAPLAVGQRAYVMVRCPSCVCPSIRSY